jgi:hypothetical protein
MIHVIAIITAKPGRARLDTGLSATSALCAMVRRFDLPSRYG